jgi:hypothetical protein
MDTTTWNRILLTCMRLSKLQHLTARYGVFIDKVGRKKKNKNS